MKWQLIGKNRKGDPFAFESSAVKGAIRNALLSYGGWMRDGEDAESILQRRSLLAKPGLYLLFNNDTEEPKLAGFWVVFGHHYLEDGVRGAPDRDPPYADDVLEALTEEVWWKNLDVWPLANKTWRPVLIFEWPSDLSFRSEAAPPGLGMPDSEFAENSDLELGE